MNPKEMSKFIQAKIWLASHPYTKSEVLEKLANSKQEHVVARTGENANTHVKVLKKLARHESVDVRIAVAENASTPFPTLLTLAKDDHPDVRYSLAENHNTPSKVLALLKEDENPYVAVRAARTLERLDTNKFLSNSWLMQPKSLQIIT